MSPDEPLTLREVVAALESVYPPETAMDWDQVGLVAGDLDQAVRTVHFAIDPTLALEARCEAAVDIVQRRVASLWRILAALGGANLPGVPRQKNENRPSFLRAVATVFEPDRARLRMEPMEAADVLRGLTIASSHPALTVGEPKTPREIASVILDGIRTPTDAARTC